MMLDQFLGDGIPTWQSIPFWVFTIKELKQGTFLGPDPQFGFVSVCHGPTELQLLTTPRLARPTDSLLRVLSSR